MEDDVFRVSEYTINSAPKTGEAPYKRTYVNELPDFSSATVAQDIENDMPVAYSSGTKNEKDSFPLHIFQNKCLPDILWK